MILVRCFALAVISVFMSAQVFAQFNQKGGPQRVYCRVSTHSANHEIRSGDSLETLLSRATHKRVVQTSKTCPKNEGKVLTCELNFQNSELRLRYYFNTQTGGLQIEDLIAGQSSESEWTNQYNLTQSGYLHTSTEMTNLRGGLLGQSRLFRIEASCYATARSWQTKK